METLDNKNTFFPNARKKLAETKGYGKYKGSSLAGLATKGALSELTMGYFAPDETPELRTTPEKIAYSAGSLVGMMPTFAAAAAVPLLAPEAAALKGARIAKLIDTLHKIGKVHKVADKAGKIRNVSKLGIAAETALKSGRTFGIHGALHELPPEEREENVLKRLASRALHGAESVPSGMAFGAVSPLAKTRLGHIGTSAGTGAALSAISGGTTEDVLIQGGLLGLLSAAHIGTADARKMVKNIAKELDKKKKEDRNKSILELLYPGEEGKHDYSKLAREMGVKTEEEQRLFDILERAKARSESFEPMDVPGFIPAGEKFQSKGVGDWLEARSKLKRAAPPSPKYDRLPIEMPKKEMGEWLGERSEAEKRTFQHTPEFDRLPGTAAILGKKPEPSKEIVTPTGETVKNLKERKKAATRERLAREIGVPVRSGVEDWLGALKGEKKKPEERRIIEPEKKAEGLSVFGIKRKPIPKPKERETKDIGSWLEERSKSLAKRKVKEEIPVAGKKPSKPLSPLKPPTAKEMRAIKTDLLKEIDAAISEAGDTPEKGSEKLSFSLGPTLTTEYLVENTRESLKKFRNVINKHFTVTSPSKKKSVLPTKTSMGSKRIDSPDIEYYSEFRPRKTKPYNDPKKPVALIGDGFVGFNGTAYGMKLGKVPDVKKSEVLDYSDKKIVDTLTGKTEPATILGEFKRINSTQPAAHVKDESGNNYTFKAKDIDAITTRFPGAKPFVVEINEKVHVLLFKDKNEVVAFAMELGETGEIQPQKPLTSLILDIEKTKKISEVKGKGAAAKKEISAIKKMFGEKKLKESPRRIFRMTEDVEIKNTSGEKVTLPAGEEYAIFPHVTDPKKVVLQDGKRVTVYEGDLGKLKGFELKKGVQPKAGGMVHEPPITPPRKIPEFKSTEEAMVWGEKATPEELKKLDTLRAKHSEVSEKLLGEQKWNEAMAEATKSQLYREAIEAKTQGIPDFAKEIIRKYKESNLSDEKGSSELIGDIAKLGARLIKQGYKRYSDFVGEVKKLLGSMWEKVRPVLKQGYELAKKIASDETGTWTIYSVSKKAQKAIDKAKGGKLKIGDVLSLKQRKLSADAEKVALALGVSYKKQRQTELEWEQEADRILNDSVALLDTLQKAKKGREKLTPGESRAVLKVNNATCETFANLLKRANLEDINKEINNFQTGLMKTALDFSSEYGRNLRALRDLKGDPVSLTKIGETFAKMERPIRKQDKEMWDYANKAMSLGDYRPMLSFLRYLDSTRENPEFADYVYEYWYNCILSGVPTHIVNIASNTAWGAWQIGVHKPLMAVLDPIVARFQKRPQEYYLSEIAPMMAGVVKGYREGAKPAKDILVKGHTMDAKMDKWTLEMGASMGAFARSPNKYVRAMAPLITLPTRALRAVDVWANQANYEAELAAICKRMEKQGKGSFETLMRSPTKEMQDEAAEFAAYTTFMSEPGNFAKKLEALRGTIPGGKLLIPFLRTVGNLTKRGAEMTPGLGILLGGQHIMSPKTSGRELTQVLAKQLEGAMIALVIASLVDDGKITGPVPENKAEREAFYRQGKLPWAVKVGGRWVQYRRLEPFNAPIAAVAIANTKWSQTGELSTELVWGCISSVMENILDSSYLSGVTQMLDSVRRADTVPQRVTNLLDRLVASFSPFSSFQRSLVRSVEAANGLGATVRKPKGAKQTIAASTPGLSKLIPAKKNIWGEDVVIPGGPWEQFLPWKASTPTTDKVEKEIERLHKKAGFSYPGEMAKYFTVNEKRVDLDDEQYDMLVTISGKKSKDRLDKLVGSSYWKNLSDSEKSKRIERIIRTERKKAKNILKKKLGYNVLIKKPASRKGHLPSVFSGRSSANL